jgi:hypothetical protein
VPRYQAIERWQARDGLCPHLIVERIAIVEEICEIEQQGWIVGRRSRLGREGVHQQGGWLRRERTRGRGAESFGWMR